MAYFQHFEVALAAWAAYVAGLGLVQFKILGYFHPAQVAGVWTASGSKGQPDFRPQAPIQ